MGDWLIGGGLVMNMVGVGVAFFYGFPQPQHNDAIVQWGSPSPAALDRLQRHRRRSYYGLGLIFVGFAIQLLGLLVE